MREKISPTSTSLTRNLEEAAAVLKPESDQRDYIPGEDDLPVHHLSGTGDDDLAWWDPSGSEAYEFTSR